MILLLFIEIVRINENTFSTEVTMYEGPALVLFYNSKYWQSKDMERRLEYFAKKYEGREIKFCKFHWPLAADAKAFQLEMLPTLILYRQGNEIDRIKGIPPEQAERNEWNDDIELWILKNALQLKSGTYAGKYFQPLQPAH